MVTAVSVGHVNADTRLDVFAGTDGSKLFYWTNEGSSFTRTQMADTTVGAYGKPLEMCVGDVDSDLWDDVMLATDGGYILFYRHVKGTTWDVRQVENLGKPIYAISLGDADRGVILSYT
jgi:hypothetical protein